MKRGIDHEWDIRRYVGDAAYYAFCKCGWYYACSSELRKDEPWLLYPYCPNCGARKKRYNDKVRRMEESIFELYEKNRKKSR